MSEENLDGFSRVERVGIAGIGHDSEGAYVDLHGGFGYPGGGRLRIGDAIVLRDERMFGIKVERRDTDDGAS